MYLFYHTFYSLNFINNIFYILTLTFLVFFIKRYFMGYDSIIHAVTDFYLRPETTFVLMDYTTMT